jgi:hypothetical protein
VSGNERGPRGAPRACTQPGSSTGQLHERLAAGREHAGELGQIRDDRLARGQVLEHEVADDDVAIPSSTPSSRSPETARSRRARSGSTHAPERASPARRRARAPVESIRQRRGHPARAAADLDARAAAGSAPSRPKSDSSSARPRSGSPT